MTHIQCEHGQYPHCSRCDKDESDLRLVQKQSQTLAELYRKGRAKGLLRPMKSYN